MILVLGTPGFVDLAAETNIYDDCSEGCCLQDGFDLHVSTVWLPVDAKHGSAWDKIISACKDLVLVGLKASQFPLVMYILCGVWQKSLQPKPETNLTPLGTNGFRN